jgi:hypothetical protein
MTMKDIVINAILITSFIIFVIGTYQLYVIIPNIPNKCNIPYMPKPGYVPFKMSEPNDEFQYLNSKYTLFRHFQPTYVKTSEALKVKGIPVLYVHGNKGHYKEVRSLGYTSDIIADKVKTTKRLEYFTLDFQEEASALNGAYLQDQAEYVNMAVSAILRLYRKQARGNKEKLKHAVKSVIVVGHSMGGIAATHALSLSSYRQGSISTIITLSSPHAYAPIYLDSAMDRLYTQTYNTWSIGSRFIAFNYFLDKKVQDEKNKAAEAAAVEKEMKKKEAAADGQINEGGDILNEFEDTNLPKETPANDGNKKNGKGDEAAIEESNGNVSSWFSLSNIPLAGYFFRPSKVNVSRVNTADNERRTAVSSATLFTKKAAHRLRKVVLISLSGGLKDNLVEPSSASIAHMSTPDKSLGILTSEIPHVNMHMDHNSIVWCKQLDLRINEALYNAVDSKTGFIYKKVGDRMQVLRETFMSPAHAMAAENASILTTTGVNRTVPFWHDRIYGRYIENDNIIFGENDELETYFGTLIRRYGKLILSMSISIMLLSFGYQLYMYLPFDGKTFPPLQEALQPEKHLFWVIIGEARNTPGNSDKHVASYIGSVSVAWFIVWFIYGICDTPAYQTFFQEMSPESVYWFISLIGRTLRSFWITTLLPVDRNFPPLLIFGFIYFISLSIIHSIVRICLLMQRATAFFPGNLPSNISEVFINCSGSSRSTFVGSIFRAMHVFFLLIVCLIIGHIKFEDIRIHSINDVLNSLLIVRESGITIGRMLASMIIMFQIGTTFSTLRFLFIKTVDKGGNTDLDNFRLSVGVLLLLMVPFQVSTFFKATNTILSSDRGYARAIYDLTICCVQVVGLYLLSESPTTLPARCAQQLKNGNKMYYGIEIGPHGPTPQQSEAIRNAVWKDTVCKDLQRYVDDIYKDYLEMVDLVKQVNKAQDVALPETYDKSAAKKHTHLYRLCGTLTEQKLMKKLLQLDLIETRGNQDIRAVRKAIIARINRYLKVGDELKKQSKEMDKIYEDFGALNDRCKKDDTNIVVDGETENIGFDKEEYKKLSKRWKENGAVNVEAPLKTKITEDVLLNNLPIFHDPFTVPKITPNGNNNKSVESKDRMFFSYHDFDMNAMFLVYFTCLLGGCFMCMWFFIKIYHAVYFLSALAGLLFLRETGLYS